MFDMLRFPLVTENWRPYHVETITLAGRVQVHFGQHFGSIYEHYAERADGSLVSDGHGVGGSFEDYKGKTIGEIKKGLGVN
ncbi:MAG: hypothetical protein NT120_04015 [Candidatus Aenigmarchaeota archaeon]|nr:hypothetical protein [Candidatus Aenigmarchaeota archaeon]